MHYAEGTVLVFTFAMFTNCVSVGGNAVASVYPFIRLFPLYLRNRLIVDPALLHASRSQP